MQQRLMLKLKRLLDYGVAQILQASQTKGITFKAGSSLLILWDDIATVLDDVSLMIKVAAKKTAALLE